MIVTPTGSGIDANGPSPGAFGAGRPTGRSSWRALLLIGITAAACPPSSPPPPLPLAPTSPGPSGVARIEISPDGVHAAAGLHLELTSRAYDAAGRLVLPTTALPVTWTTPTDGSIELSPNANRAAVQILTSTSQSVEIKAAMGGATGAGILHLHGTAPNPDFGPAAISDWLAAPHAPEAPPAIAVIRAEGYGGTVVEEFVAFAGLARLPNFVAPGSLALFTPGKRVVHATPAWTPASDRIDLTADAERVVPVRLWNATGTDLGGFYDVATTNLVFSRNRTGIRFAMDWGNPAELGPMAVTPGDCARPEDIFGTSVFDPSVQLVHVFVVTTIGEGWRGYACPGDPTPGRPARAIFLAVTRTATTLAHEFGHLMALLDPLEHHGHTQCQWGFAADNLMWAFLDDAQAANRLHLSTGQVYRIAIDRRSWLTAIGMGAATSAPVCNTPGATCPSLPMPQAAVQPDDWPRPYCDPL